jgi:hypothetical protein
MKNFWEMNNEVKGSFSFYERFQTLDQAFEVMVTDMENITGFYQISKLKYIYMLMEFEEGWENPNKFFYLVMMGWSHLLGLYDDETLVSIFKSIYSNGKKICSEYYVPSRKTGPKSSKHWLKNINPENVINKLAEDDRITGKFLQCFGI